MIDIPPACVQIIDGDGLPADYDRALWYEPLTFQGLVGSALAGRFQYTDLFRESGFAKSIAELSASGIAPNAAEVARDKQFRAHMGSIAS